METKTNKRRGFCFITFKEEERVKKIMEKKYHNIGLSKVQYIMAYPANTSHRICLVAQNKFYFAFNACFSDGISLPGPVGDLLVLLMRIHCSVMSVRVWSFKAWLLKCFIPVFSVRLRWPCPRSSTSSSTGVEEAEGDTPPGLPADRVSWLDRIGRFLHQYFAYI